MKSIVYMQVDDEDSFDLLDKITELGYEKISRHVSTRSLGGHGFQIYCVEMTEEDLVLLRLAVPFIQIDKHTYGT